MINGVCVTHLPIVPRGEEVIKATECGWNVNAGDADSLAELVISLSNVDKQDLIDKGRKGKEYYDNFFTRKMFEEVG